MKRIALALVGIGALAGVVATTAPVSGQSDGEAAPIYGIKYFQGYRDWHLISVKRLTGKQLTGTGAELRQLRAELGNDLAIKAFRDGTLPFPDGTMIAALHWNEELLRHRRQGPGCRSSRRRSPLHLRRVRRERSVHG